MATQIKRPRTVGGAVSKQPSQRTRLGPMRQRLINSWRAPDHHAGGVEPPPIAAAADLDRPPADDVLPRFPIVRQGYDCLAVDQYILELERELDESDRELEAAKAQAQAPDDVHRELARIGEQTSAVLIAANEQRDEILRAAREEAERRINEAAAQASALVSQAEIQVRDLRVEKEATQRERERLLEDARAVSAELTSLVDAAHQRIPPNGATSKPAPAASGQDTEQWPVVPAE
ncbi:MAG TPA: DivIVA domain-containing protein [Solirubrobacteraceae bacterium]|nr:DivIVA domain-containing protein [Solirubrobacteraceae bacterium]